MEVQNRYYWLKLYDKFLQDYKIKMLRKNQNGSDFVVIYIALMLNALNKDGEVLQDCDIPLTPQLIGTVAEFDDVGIVESALDQLEALNLIIMKDGRMFVPQVLDMIGSECDSAARVREYRTRKKANGQTLQCNNVTAQCNVDIDKDIDIDNIYIAQNSKKASKADKQEELFSRFWQEYPRKESRKEAQKAFNKLKVDDALLDKMLAAVELQKKSDQWQQQEGKFIPYAATWLNNRRWEDEPPPIPQQTIDYHSSLDFDAMQEYIRSSKGVPK